MAKAFEITELNNYIKNLIDSDPMLTSVTVRGELSNYKVYPSGHHYFTMKDATGALRCVMFKSRSGRLRFRPESGMKVIATGSVTVFPRDGAYQLYVDSLTPDGVGDLHVAYEQLKARLAEEGLFARELKKPIPRFPEKIAVITSSAGAAVRDIIRVLGARYPLAKVIILPVRVQGDEAPPEIVGAIKYANRYNIADVIITGRGGGSIEDLWAFNDERVARAIFASEIPVISAVGHEPDVTISDYVADLRAATPSNAAELAVPDMQELREQIAAFAARAAAAPERQIAAARQKLEAISDKRVLQNPMNYVDDKRVLLDHIRTRVLAAESRAISSNREKFVRLAAKLDALSPLKVLGRGYAIATNESGAVIKSAADAKSGDKLSLRLEKDEIHCTVD